MMRALIKFAAFAVALCVTAAVADAESNLLPIGGFSGLSFGQSPEQADALVVADWMPAACAQERFYYPADAEKRSFLADVRLVWPGLLYRFVDNRLYTVQAEYPTGEKSFARLQRFLTTEYGAPDVTESWHHAPADTYIYQQRMNLVGWYGPNGTPSVWLTNDNRGGSLTMVDNAVARWGMQQIGVQCAATGSGVGDASGYAVSSRSATE